MTHKEYNREIQELQRLPWDTRVVPLRRSTGEIFSANFEIYYGGWHLVGWESPFTEGRNCYFNRDLAAKLVAQFGRDVIA